MKASHGYYAPGVAPSTAILPRGREERLVPLRNENTRGAIGWCLEIHDLLVSKLIAGRQNIQELFRVAVGGCLADLETLAARLEQAELASEELRVIEQARLSLP